MTATAVPSAGLSPADRHVRAIFEKAAPRYDATMDFFERLMVDDGRRWACSRARGRVLEIAIGTGRNLEHYPEDVRLAGVDISPAMLARAERRAYEQRRSIDLREGTAEALEWDDETFDTVVSTLSLCTIPDDRAAIAEAWRVLRPGGSLVLCEHVRSPTLPVRLGQRLLEPACVHLEGDHLLRDPLDHLEREGFTVAEIERRSLGIMERARAVKPARAGR